MPPRCSHLFENEQGRVIGVAPLVCIERGNGVSDGLAKHIAIVCQSMME